MQALEPGIERKKKGKAMKSIAFPFFLDAPFQGFLLWHLLCIIEMQRRMKIMTTMLQLTINNSKN